MYALARTTEGPRKNGNENGAGTGTGTTTTKFRAAEKRYQLHKEEQFRENGGKNGRRRRRGGRFNVRPVDLSDVIDVHAALQQAAATGTEEASAGSPHSPRVVLPIGEVRRCRMTSA